MNQSEIDQPKWERVLLPVHVSVYISPYLVILHLTPPVSLSTTARHWTCTLRSGETEEKDMQILLNEMNIIHTAFHFWEMCCSEDNFRNIKSTSPCLMLMQNNDMHPNSDLSLYIVYLYVIKCIANTSYNCCRDTPLPGMSVVRVSIGCPFTICLFVTSQASINPSLPAVGPSIWDFTTRQGYN